MCNLRHAIHNYAGGMERNSIPSTGACRAQVGESVTVVTGNSVAHALRLENFHLDTHTNINILASGLMNSWTTQSPYKKFMIMPIEL